MIQPETGHILSNSGCQSLTLKAPLSSEIHTQNCMTALRNRDLLYVTLTNAS